MYGWRVRIGLIPPSANSVVEPEFWGAVPAGVSVHASRMRLLATGEGNMRALADEMEPAARLLAHVEPDVLAFACTTGTVLPDGPTPADIEARLRELTGGVPAVAMAASVRRALDALDVSRVALVTPYPAAMDEHEVAFLEAHGVEVVARGGPEIESTLEKGALPPSRLYREARATDGSAADAVFVSCANVRTFEVLDALESDLGKPVVSSNAASLWDALRTAGVAVEGVGPGTLFDG